MRGSLTVFLHRGLSPISSRSCQAHTIEWSRTAAALLRSGLGGNWRARSALHLSFQRRSLTRNVRLSGERMTNHPSRIKGFRYREPEEPSDEKLIAGVESHGWHIVGVPDDEAGPALLSQSGSICALCNQRYSSWAFHLSLPVESSTRLGTTSWQAARLTLKENTQSLLTTVK